MISFIDDYDQVIFTTESTVIPRIGETVIVDDIYQVIDVVYAVQESSVMVYVEPKKDNIEQPLTQPVSDRRIAVAEQTATAALQQNRRLKNQMANLSYRINLNSRKK